MLNLKGKSAVPRIDYVCSRVEVCTQALFMLDIPASGGSAADEPEASSSQPQAFK